MPVVQGGLKQVIAFSGNANKYGLKRIGYNIGNGSLIGEMLTVETGSCDKIAFFIQNCTSNTITCDPEDSRARMR